MLIRPTHHPAEHWPSYTLTSTSPGSAEEHADRVRVEIPPFQDVVKIARLNRSFTPLLREKRRRGFFLSSMQCVHPLNFSLPSYIVAYHEER